MKNLTLLCLIFLTISHIYSQKEKENIELPETVGFEIKYSNHSITPIFSVYINKDKEVFFEHVKLDNIAQVADTLNKYRSKLRIQDFAFSRLLLHADRNLKYAVIDSVKSALSSVTVPYIFYRTNHIEDITSGVIKRNQASLFYKKILEPHSDIEPSGKLAKEVEVSIGKHPIEDMRDIFYELKFKEAKEKLSKFKYKNIEFIGGKYLKIDSKVVILTDDEVIYEQIKDLDFYFLSSDDNLIYDDYIKSMIAIINVLKKYKIDTPAVEISNSLKEQLTKNSIKL